MFVRRASTWTLGYGTTKRDELSDDSDVRACGPNIIIVLSKTIFEKNVEDIFGSKITKMVKIVKLAKNDDFAPFRTKIHFYAIVYTKTDCNVATVMLGPVASNPG